MVSLEAQALFTCHIPAAEKDSEREIERGRAMPRARVSERERERARAGTRVLEEGAEESVSSDTYIYTYACVGEAVAASDDATHHDASSKKV